MEATSALTAIANEVLSRAGQPSGDGLFLNEAQRILLTGSAW